LAPSRTAAARWPSGAGVRGPVLVRVAIRGGHRDQPRGVDRRRSGGSSITRIELQTEAEVSGIGEDEFQQHAETAKANCPVSKALAGVDISLEATLGG
jgi:organic hydroperoxide reductase OsmC/OhrA